MFGDLLLSSPFANAAVRLPTLSKIEAAFRKRYSPWGMAQKVAIMSPQLVVAWSGNYAVAREVLREMKGSFGSRRISETELNEFLAESGKRHPGEISLLGMLSLENSRIYQCSYDAWGFQDQRFGFVRMAGSGRDAVARALRSIQGFEETNNRAINPLEKAIGYSLTMAGYLQGHEISTAQNFDEYYGAGYEIATPKDGCWVKVDDFLMIYWMAEEQVAGGVSIVPFPQRCIRAAYVDDIMTVRSLGIGDHGKIEDHVFPVPPVYRDLTTHEKQNPVTPDLNASWICHQFVVKRLDGTLSPRSRVTFSSNLANSPLRLSWTGDQLEVVTAPGYFEVLRGYAQSPIV